MLYTKEIIENKLGDFTESEKVANSLGWTITKDESEVEQGYDGNWYLLGYAPLKPLEELKSEKITELKTARDTEEQTYFTYDEHRYDSDSTSCQRIAIASQNALTAKLAGTDFSIVWTDYDNNEVTLDSDGLIAMSGALATHSNAVHVYYGTKKSEVEAITEDTTENRALIESITWDYVE